MTKSVIVWKCFIVFGYMLQPVYTGATKTSKACYGTPGLSCTRHDISCNSTQKIAIYDAYYTDNSECGETGSIANCLNWNPDNVTERGHHRFNNTELVSLYNNCSTDTRCVYRAPRRIAALAFSVVKYQCIKKGELLNTSGGVAEGLSQVLLIHRENRMPNSAIETFKYMCTFKSNVATSISVYALETSLGRATPGQCFSSLSVLPENEIIMNNCSSVFQPFKRLNVTAELPMSLNIVDSPRSSSALIWLLINGSDLFNVTCEPVTGAGTSTGTIINHSSSTDDNHISTGSSRSTMAIDIPPTATSRGYTQTTTESSGIATTNNTVLTENDAPKKGDTGAIIGGVVATILAILVVTLVSVRLKGNCRAKGEGNENIASFPLEAKPCMTHNLAGNIPQNNYHDIQDLKTQNMDYDYATADGLAIPPTAHTYLTIEPAGKQNAKRFSKASTTENNYDHIGGKPTPQTSDYDTTASMAQPEHTGGTTGEDFYGYNHFQKKTNPQTHQNDYDTAASATKAVAQLNRTGRNSDDDDYDHFPRVTNHPETVSSPYDTTSGMADNSDYSVAGSIT